MIDRQYVDVGVFDNLLPEGAKIYAKLQIPTIEAKRKKRIYTLPDFRLLHPAGAELMKEIIADIVNYTRDEVVLDFPADTDEDTLDIACNIVMAVGIGMDCGKRGFDNFSLVTGMTTETFESGKIRVRFHVVEDFARYIYRQSFEDGKIDFYKLLMDYADHEDARIVREMKRMQKKEAANGAAQTCAQ